MISNNIKQLRKIKNMSQQDLANKLGISFKTVSHWEAGYTEPSIEMIKKLKDIFNASYEELLD